MLSNAPPPANGNTGQIGLDGKPCASASPGVARPVCAAAATSDSILVNRAVPIMRFLRAM